MECVEQQGRNGEENTGMEIRNQESESRREGKDTRVGRKTQMIK